MNTRLMLCAVALATSACAGPAPRPASAQAPPNVADRHCLRETGSRLPPLAGRCLSLPGQSFTREDIERTGAIGTADALRRLTGLR